MRSIRNNERLYGNVFVVIQPMGLHIGCDNYAYRVKRISDHITIDRGGNTAHGCKCCKSYEAAERLESCARPDGKMIEKGEYKTQAV